MKSFIGRKSPLITSLQSAIRNPQSAITVVFAAMLVVSWRRWISPVTDSGREMDLPLRLMNGEMLYRDVHYIYPPFSPYFHSFLYRIFGANLDVLQMVGAVCAVLVVWMCYRIARRLMTPSESAIAVIAVILVCVFKPAGNLIWPYAFSALHSMVFALGALLLALRYAENEKRRELIAAGVLIGLAAITKQEFALAAVCAVAAAVAWMRRNDYRRLATDLAVAAAPALLIALPVYAAMIAFVGWKTIVEDCHLFYTHLPASLVLYNSHRTGLGQPLFSFMQMIGAASVGMVALSVIALLSARGGRSAQRARWIWIALGLSLFVALAIRLIAGNEWDGSPMRALPFLLLAMIVIGRRKRDGALFIIAAYSLAILARVVLRVPSGGAFGAFFLPTSLILFCYLFLRLAPGAVGRWTQDRLALRRAHLIGAAMLIALLLPTAVVYAVRYRRNFDFELETSRGELFVRRPIGVAYREALDFIAERTTPADAIVILPEGSELAFLGERRMAMRLQILQPGFLDEQGERDEIARLQAARTRYALVVNRPMHEFGADVFGRDYYPTLGRWIDERYRLVKVCGVSQDERLQIGDKPFFVKVFEIRD
ncbi:MAG TPA: glycosyltransferase family 39 protein [Blastocatellia bacterium]|nr:glycosyltransferase family 39 protein [Blastocatellia bacterium]